MSSPFAGIFSTYTLTFSGGTSGSTISRDADGKLVHSAVEDIVVKCTLKEIQTLGAREKAYFESAGVDLSQFLLEGRFVEPMIWPDTLKPGMTSELELPTLGEGIVTLEPAWPPQLSVVEEAIGSRILCSWSKNDGQ